MPSLKIEITRNFVEVRDLNEEVVLGRGRHADVVLLHASVSRKHARVFQKDTEYIIEDLNSSNGLKVNGESVHSKLLEHGDTIEIGINRLFYSNEDLGIPQRIIDLTLRPEDADTKLAVARNLSDVAIRFVSEERYVELVQVEIGRMLELLDFDDRERMNIETAMNEAIGNAVRHGHQYEQSKIVEFRYIRKPDRLIVRVADEGPGFDYRAMLKRGMELDAVDAARQRYMEGGMGGLGILMMLRCMDKVEYNNLGNEVTLSRYLTEEARQAAAPPPSDTDHEIATNDLSSSTDETQSGTD